MLAQKIRCIALRQLRHHTVQRRHVLRANHERWWCRCRHLFRQLKSRVVGTATGIYRAAEVTLEVLHLGLVNVVKLTCAASLRGLAIVAVDAVLHDQLLANRTASDLTDLACLAVVHALGRRLNGRPSATRRERREAAAGPSHWVGPRAILLTRLRGLIGLLVLLWWWRAARNSRSSASRVGAVPRTRGDSIMSNMRSISVCMCGIKVGNGLPRKGVTRRNGSIARWSPNGESRASRNAAMIRVVVRFGVVEALLAVVQCFLVVVLVCVYAFV